MPRADWGAGLSSGLAGGLAGFGIGGPVGAGVGALLGGVGGIFGGRRKPKKRSTLDPYQQALYDQQFQALQGQGPLADMYNYNPGMANDVFDQNYARPAYRNFQENLIPSITGQFRNQGLMDSSYAGDSLSRLARDVQEGLDAQRTQYLYGQEQAAKQNRMQGLENMLSRQTFAYDKAANQGGFNIDSILSQLTPSVIDDLKDYFSGPTFSNKMTASNVKPSNDLLRGMY